MEGADLAVSLLSPRERKLAHSVDSGAPMFVSKTPKQRPVSKNCSEESITLRPKLEGTEKSKSKGDMSTKRRSQTRRSLSDSNSGIQWKKKSSESRQ